MTSFVSLMPAPACPWRRSQSGRAYQRSTTEVVYRRELRPVITSGAEIMDKIFSG
jgi:hypothetical protein